MFKKLVGYCHPWSRGRSLLALVATACVALAVGCGDDDDDSGAAGGKTYTIGVTQPATGPFASVGESATTAIKLAVREINDTKVLGADKLALDVQDNRSDLATQVSQFKAFASDDGVLGVVCCNLSPEGEAVKELAATLEVPTVMVNASAEGLPEPPYLYRTLYNAYAPGGLLEQTIEGARDNWKPKTAAIVYSGDNDAFVNSLPAVEEYLEKAGMEVVAKPSVTNNDKDFSGPAAEVVSKGADLVMVHCVPGGQVVRALRQQGYDGHLISTYGLSGHEQYELAGKAIAGMVFAPNFSPLSRFPKAREFAEAYEAAYDREPDYFAALAYQSVWFLAEAIKQGGTDREKLATALSEIKMLDNVLGPIEMRDGEAHFDGPVPVFLEWKADGSQGPVWEN